MSAGGAYGKRLHYAVGEPKNIKGLKFANINVEFISLYD